MSNEGEKEYNLGDKYYYGEGVWKNPVKAVYWANKASKKGLNTEYYLHTNYYGTEAAYGTGLT